MNDIDRAADKLQESYDYMDSVFAEKRRPAKIELLNAIKCGIEALREKAARENPQPLSAWSEDDGSVLWWAFPINEPPYCGTPLDEYWPGYHTHFTPLTCPNEPIADYPPKEDK